RRHTRCLSDWSSDVCSSDLLWVLARRASASQLVTLIGTHPSQLKYNAGRNAVQFYCDKGELIASLPLASSDAAPLRAALGSNEEIGRASCRESVAGRDREHA